MEWSKADRDKTKPSTRVTVMHAGMPISSSPSIRTQDWVFGNRDGRPRWQESILHRQLKPAALRAGLGRIGWHTFRHSYSTLLRGAHVDLKVQQELLRHSTIQSTINIYTRAVPKEKRAANRLVVGRLLRAQNWKSVSVTVAK